MTSPAECAYTLHSRTSRWQDALARLRAFMARLWDATPFGAFGSFGEGVEVPQPLPSPEPSHPPSTPHNPQTLEDLTRLLRPGDAFVVDPVSSQVVVLRREDFAVRYHRRREPDAR